MSLFFLLSAYDIQLKKFHEHVIHSRADSFFQPGLKFFSVKYTAFTAKRTTASHSQGKVHSGMCPAVIIFVLSEFWLD